MADSDVWPRAFSTRWPRCSCRRWGTGSDTSTGCSGKPSRTVGNTSSPTTGFVAPTRGRSLVRTSDLPRVGATKPVVGLLVLPTVRDGLPEHPVLVSEPVPHRRQLHRGHRVEKARGQTSESAIAQSGVGLLFEQAEPIEGLLLDGCAHKRT